MSTTEVPLDRLGSGARYLIKTSTKLQQRSFVQEINGTGYTTYSVLNNASVNALPLNRSDVTGIFVPHNVAATLMYSNNTTYVIAGGAPRFFKIVLPTGVALSQINYHQASPTVVNATIAEAFLAKKTALSTGAPLALAYDFTCGDVPVNDPAVEKLLQEYCVANPSKCPTYKPVVQTTTTTSTAVTTTAPAVTTTSKIPTLPTASTPNSQAPFEIGPYVILFIVLLILLVVFGVPIAKKLRSKNKKKTQDLDLDLDMDIDQTRIR